MTKIAVDIDDVLLDSMPVMLDFYNSLSDEEIHYSDLNKYDYLGFLADKKQSMIDFFGTFNRRENIFLVQPFQDSQKYIRLLAKNHELVALTSRPRYIQPETEEQIQLFFPEIKTVIFNNANIDTWGTTANERSKAEICEEQDIHVLIDDQLRYTNDTHDSLRVLLLDQPWNQGDTPPNVTRVCGWKEIYDIVSASV